MHRSVIVSVRMALIIGFLLPAAETIRRFHQLLIPSQFLTWFDDYMLGALILFIAYRALKQKDNSIAHLIAMWGIASGALATSLLGEFKYDPATAPPAVFSHTTVIIGKAIILIYMITGLYFATKANRSAPLMPESTK